MRIGLIWMVLTFLVAGSVQAHRLTVEWKVMDGTLEIRALTGSEPAAGGDVVLQDASGAVLAHGVLDAAGRFHWPLAVHGPITVDVNAGLGHRRNLTLTEAQLRPGMAEPGGAKGAAGEADDPGVQASGSSDLAYSQAVRIGLGLTFLVAAAAAWMGYRNTRRLARLEQRLERHEGGG
jgi:hypothetical protein